MIMVGETKKSGAIEDDYICPACSIPRLAWQTECSECGHKFDEDIEIKSDQELEEDKRKDKEAKRFEKKKKGYWRNLDPKEYSKIRNSMYAAELVLLILLVLNTIYMNMDFDPFYLPIGPPLLIILVFGLVFTLEGLWFKYVDILRAGRYEKRLKYIKEFRMRSQSVFVVCIILIIICMSLGSFQFFSDMLTGENNVDLPIGQTEKFEFYSQDPLGLTEATSVNVSMNRSIDTYLLPDQTNGDAAPNLVNSIGVSLNNRHFKHELDSPDYELEFSERDSYTVYGYNSAGVANSNGEYTVDREFSKPLLFILIIFSFLFIIITICWMAFLTYTKKFYDRLYTQRIEELTSRYKVAPYTIEDVFLVYSDGTLINHQTRRLKTLDDDIFMGMLTSIKDFIKDAMSHDVKGELNELSYGKLKILIEHGAYVFLAVVVSGKPPAELRNMMKGAVRRIHQTHLATLRNWDGNIGKMEPAKKIITEMLLKDAKGTGKTSKFDKKSANAWNDRGVVYTKVGNYKEAISCFDRAIRINPRLSEVWSNKGIVLHKTKKYGRAMRCFDKALQLNPYNKKAKRRREKCWYRLKLRDAKKGQRAAGRPSTAASTPASAAPSSYPSQGLTDARTGVAPQRQRRVATATPHSSPSQDFGMGYGGGGFGSIPAQTGAGGGGGQFGGRSAGSSGSIHDEGTEPCPDCGSSMRYTHEYKDWWCDNCKRYPYEDETDDQSQQSASDYNCETCRQPLEYIDEYQKWYCDNCQKYA